MRVSDGEMEHAVERYWRGVRLLTAAVLGAGALGCFLLRSEIREALGGDIAASWPLMGVILGTFAVLLAGLNRLWRVPDRAWRNRAQAGAARSIRDVHRRRYAGVGWGQLGGSAALAIGTHAVHLATHNPWSRLFWGGMTALAVGSFLLAALRKWSSERPV